MYELQLQERKKNNLIIFGLEEDDWEDVIHLEELFSSLGVDIDVDNIQCFQIGRSLEKCRPLIVKLRNQEEKAEILYEEGRTGPGEKKDVSGPLPDAYRCVDTFFVLTRNTKFICPRTAEKHVAQ